jgi:hypothetical protein
MLAMHAASLLAQSAGFAGTWRLDASRSRIVETAGLAGLAASGAPPTLYVTQPANGTLVVESSINTSHARLYKPGGTTRMPLNVGPAGSLSLTSRWNGGALVAEGTRELDATPAPAPITLVEVLSVSPDGAALTIDVSTTSAAGETSTSRLVYTRTLDVGPCASWPTPCKVPPSPR